MWEWRVFTREMHSKELTLSKEYRKKLLNADPEHRTDYYYDLSVPELGLKERGGEHPREFKPKLELKILLEKTDWGAELWEKCIKYHVSKSINPKQGLNLNDIVEILKQQQKNSPYEEKIDLIISKLAKGKPKRVKIEKSRFQIKGIYKFDHSSSFFKLERTKVKMLRKVWYSICIESSNSQLLTEFIENQILNIPKVFTGGYPEFITKKRET